MELTVRDADHKLLAQVVLDGGRIRIQESVPWWPEFMYTLGVFAIGSGERVGPEAGAEYLKALAVELARASYLDVTASDDLLAELKRG